MPSRPRTADNYQQTWRERAPAASGRQTVVQWTEDEYRALREACDSIPTSMSAFIRKAVTAQITTMGIVTTPPRRPATAEEIGNELRRVARMNAEADAVLRTHNHKEITMHNPAHSEEQRIGTSIYTDPVWMNDTVRELARQLPEATSNLAEADRLVVLAEEVARENGEDFVEIPHVHEAIIRLHRGNIA